MHKGTNFEKTGKTTSVICKEVFDDGYQPLNEGMWGVKSHLYLFFTAS